MDRLLTTEEVAEMLPFTPGTLRWMRHAKTGPKSFKLGGRKVVYRESDVLAWVEEQAASSEAPA